MLGSGGRGQDSLSRDLGWGTSQGGVCGWGGCRGSAVSGLWEGQGLTVGDGHPSAEYREGSSEECSQEGGQLWLGVPLGCCEEVGAAGAWSLQSRERCPSLT